MHLLKKITLFIILISLTLAAHAADLPFDSIYIQQSKFVDDKKDVLEFYKNRNYALAWFDKNKPVKHAALLLERLNNVQDDGLIIEHYSFNEINKLKELINKNNLTEEQIKQTELMLTNLYFHYARHLNLGLLQPKDVGFNWNIREKSHNLVHVLEEILADNGNDPFRRLEPQHKMYRQLKNELKRYRKIEENGGWPVITGIKVLKIGEEHIQVPKIRERLVITGDLSNNNQSNIYDEELALAVKRFQVRHGLKIDSIFGPQTMGAMNIPVQDRIKQIIVNMERYRWVPDDLGNPHIVVNIPAFELYVREDEKQVLQMKVITGRSVTSTVLFSDSIEYIEMSPYWNVPRSIATKEILPKAKKNRNYITANNFEVLSGSGVVNPRKINWYRYNASNFPYQIRQKPGPTNSLGTIKFIFPNQYNIYLHDTPAKHLFNEAERDFSHGCIRVEKPLELAKYLLRNNPDWDEQKIEAHRKLSTPERVYLDKKVPVYIMYFTAFVDQEGRMNFREDIYKHDDDIVAKYFSQR